MTLMNSEKPLLYLVSVNDGAENEHQIESAPEPEVTEFGYTLEELQAAARRQDAWLAKAVRHHDVERYAEDHHATYRDGQIWLEEHHRSNTASREEDDGPDLR